MSNTFCLREYREIAANYTEIEYLTPLIGGIELIHVAQSEAYLKVTWIERLTEDVFVDGEGWYVLTAEKYPTFEALAMNRSEAYNSKWGEALTKRLKELDQVESD